MAKYRNSLPQLSNRLFLTDGGLETTLIFHEGVDLPYFAAFNLLNTEVGSALLYQYFISYAELAKRFELGLILESPTWRASKDWAILLGYSKSELAAVNRKAIELLERIRKKYDSLKTPIILSGCIGPRDDGYIPNQIMSEDEAENYHHEQIKVLSTTTADMLSALTLNYSEEAIGITRAASKVGMPVVISFTVEIDGCLPTGQSLKDAIQQVDIATLAYPIYYMINCAHPSHFLQTVSHHEVWTTRIRGVRANASKKSHAELNEASELDAGDPKELGKDYIQLKKYLDNLNILGGCCGTDTRHIEQIALSCLPLFMDAKGSKTFL